MDCEIKYANLACHKEDPTYRKFNLPRWHFSKKGGRAFEKTVLLQWLGVLMRFKTDRNSFPCLPFQHSMELQY